MNAENSHAFSACNTLECPDRIVITGLSLDFGFEDAMRRYCRLNRIAETGVAAWARPLTDRIAALANQLGKETRHGVIDCNVFRGRKDEFVRNIISQNPRMHAGVIAVFKSMENCRSFYRSQSALKALKGSPFYLRQSKCLHYYFYVLVPGLGLVCIRIQSYAPFQLQVIINGHDVLAEMLSQDRIPYIKRGNAFIHIGDFQHAQDLARSITGPLLVARLQDVIHAISPLHDVMPRGYRLTVRQVEFSTDIYLTSHAYADDRFRQLVHQLVLFNPQDILTYIQVDNRRSNLARSSGRRNHLGTCVKFFHGPTCIKVYHKERGILRIETVSYNLTKISAVRTIRRRDGTTHVARRPLSRSLADIGAFWAYAINANRRMKDRLGGIWDRTYSPKQTRRVADRATSPLGAFRGMNLFATDDSALIACITNPAFDLTGFKRSDIMQAIPALTKHQATYAIKRLRAHGLIKKENRSHRYFLTRLGRLTTATSVALKALIVTPLLAA